MSFSRYPVSGNPPLSLAGGAAGAFIPFTPHIGAAGGLNHMYIHIAMSSAGADPQVNLWANGGAPPAVGGGFLVPYSAGGSYSTLNDSSGTAIGAVFMRKLPALEDGTPVTTIYQVDLLLFGMGDTNWHIRITNVDAALREFTWVVADTPAEAEQPWLNVTTPTLTYNVLVSQPVASASQTIQIANRGTGMMTVAGLEAGSTIAPNFSLGPMPSAIPPGGTGNITVDVTGVQAAPLSQGINANLTLSVAKPDIDATTVAGHSKRFTINATFKILQIALLLDTSGSMSYTDGGAETRWSKLISAANSFLDLLCNFGSGSGTIGIARFPQSGGQSNINAPVAIPNDAAALKASLTTVVVNGGTPMGEGLNFVNTPANGYFPNDGIASTLKSRWVIMFSDGAHNSGVVPEPTANTMRSNGIQIYTVRYGVPGNSDVDHARLQAIAFAAGYSVEATGTPNALAAAFATVLKSGIAPIEAAADPGGTLTSANSEVRQQVLITPYDQKAVFSLYWNTADAGRMRLQLLTPTCDLITPEEHDRTHINFIGDRRYQSFTIDRAYLENADDPAQPRFGTWTLIISSDQLGAGETEAYHYDTLLDSRLQLGLGFDRTVYYAGDSIGITARLTLDGAPVTGASVNVEITSPAFSINNQLATIPVTAFQMAEAQASIPTQDVSLWQVKRTAIDLFKLGTIVYGSTKRILTLTETTPGVYTGNFTQTSVPENYDFYVTASGLTTDNIQFRREKSRQIYLQVRPAPDFSILWYEYRDLVFEPDQPYRAIVHVLPRDHFGHYLIASPDDPSSLNLEVKGARDIGQLVANPDGSYSMSAIFDANTAPLVSLRSRDTLVTPPQVSASLGRLRFAEQVLDYRPGRDGESDFFKPENVLGNPFQKADDVFAALGSYGSIVVTNDEDVIRARGENDVFVFVQPDEDLRSYKVEALNPTSRGWVLLGTSQGASQGFSLRAAKLRATKAIRITDTSGRARDRNLKSLRAPGLSIRGVGFAASRETPRFDTMAADEQQGGCLPRLISAVIRLLTGGR